MDAGRLPWYTKGMDKKTDYEAEGRKALERMKAANADRRAAQQKAASGAERAAGFWGFCVAVFTTLSDGNKSKY